MPCAPSVAHATLQREQERAARSKERRLWRREHWEQYGEEYRLGEQQGLSPRDAGGVVVGRGGGGERWGRPPERWNPPPPSLEAAEAAVESAPVAGADAPATRFSVEEPASAVEAPAGATAALAGATAMPPEPSRKRKRGFSNLR
jgi:hypothetical protein